MDIKNMKSYIFTILLALFSLNLYAETVKTIDGRTIALNENGTYKIIEAKASTNKAMVEVSSHLFKHHTGDYSQKSIRFMPIFKNVTDRNITAIKFTAHFLNPFGDEIMRIDGESEEKIKPGKNSKANLFYVFKDNQFIDAETYDKLLGAVTNGTGSIKTEAKIIVFESGEVIKL